MYFEKMKITFFVEFFKNCRNRNFSSKYMNICIKGYTYILHHMIIIILLYFCLLKIVVCNNVNIFPLLLFMRFSMHSIVIDLEKINNYP